MITWITTSLNWPYYWLYALYIYIPQTINWVSKGACSCWAHAYPNENIYIFSPPLTYVGGGYRKTNQGLNSDFPFRVHFVTISCQWYRMTWKMELDHRYTEWFNKVSFQLEDKTRIYFRCWLHGKWKVQLSFISGKFKSFYSQAVLTVSTQIISIPVYNTVFEV